MAAASHNFQHFNLSQFDINNILNINVSIAKEEEPGPNYNQSNDPACNSYLFGSNDVKYTERVCLFISLAFVIIGLIGNTFSFLVFSSKEMRTISSNVYLLLLACSDSFYLISVFLSKVLTMMRCIYFVNTELDFHHRNNAWCKILQFMQDLCSNYSTCLILAFTVERFVAVFFPIKFKEKFNVTQAQVACGLMFLIIALEIAPYHFLYMHLHNGHNVCIINEDYEDIFAKLYLAEMTVFRIVPVFIIAVLNISIIIRVSQLQRERKRRRSSRTPAQGSKTQRRSQRAKDEKNMQITVMLILVSTSYIIMFIPVLILFIINKLQKANVITLSIDTLWIAQSTSSTMYIFGFAINFFLYTLSGRVFREQLVNILCDRSNVKNKKQKGYHNGQTLVTHCPDATTVV